MVFIMEFIIGAIVVYLVMSMIMKTGGNEDSRESRSSNNKSKEKEIEETLNQIQVSKEINSNSKKKEKNETINKDNNNGILNNDARKIISRLIGNPCNQQISNSMRVKAELRNILNVKLERSSYNQEQYAETLQRNILFIINVMEDKEALIKSWIRSGRIPSIDKCIHTINSIPDTYKGNNVYCKNREKLNTYDKYFPMTRKIEQLEYDYMFYSIHSEIIHMLLEVILSNQDEFLKLSNYNAELVIGHIDTHCTSTASHCLGTLKLENV